MRQCWSVNRVDIMSGYRWSLKEIPNYFPVFITRGDSQYRVDSMREGGCF